jgi:hypothetical protein
MTLCAELKSMLTMHFGETLEESLHGRETDMITRWRLKTSPKSDASEGTGVTSRCGRTERERIEEAYTSGE